MKRSEKIFLAVLVFLVLQILNEEAVSMAVLLIVILTPVVRLLTAAGSLK